MPTFPSGTVAFLFTDIEGSTRTWQANPTAMRPAVARHFELLETAIAQHGGAIFKTVGDAVCAAFSSAPAAASAALDAELALTAEDWSSHGLSGPLRVRMAVHVGHAEPREGDYFGPPLNRVARLLSAGHGGQVLLSEAALALARGQLPPDVFPWDLGVHRLKDLLEPERITQLVHPDLPADFPALVTLDARPQNLPIQPTPLLGREEDVARIVELVGGDTTRLLTLSGPGGTGKTRLALQAAAELVDAFPDGVWLVELAPIIDHALVASEIATTLGVRAEGGRPLAEALKEYLRSRRLLLVLDNFEHVMPAAPLVGDLLAVAPGLRVLVTSRSPLRLRAEQEHPVAPLLLPRRKPPPPLEQMSQFAAVRLFIERAQAVKPDFTIDNVTAPAVAEICHRLDGLPLAIELAAARSKLLPPQAMLARLEKRLSLLTGGARDLLAHQRTLRDAIAWSEDLLTPVERTVFRRLAVFVGGFTLEAAEAVVGEPALDGSEIDVLTTLGQLVDHSLVRQSEELNEPRFSMLETIREFGLERFETADEAGEVRRHHAAFFAALVHRAGPLIGEGQEEEWAGQLESDLDNIRATLLWAIEHEPETALSMGALLDDFWDLRGYHREGRAWGERALEASTKVADVNQLLRAQALRAIGFLAERQVDYPAAEAAYRECMELWTALGDQRGMARTHRGLGHIALGRNEYRAATEHYEAAIRLWRALGDDNEVAGDTFGLGNVAYFRGEMERADELWSQAASYFRSLRHRYRLAMALNNLGALALSFRDPERAVQIHLEAIEIRRELGDELGIAYSLTNLAECTLMSGDVPTAREFLEDAMQRFQQIGLPWGVGTVLFHKAQAARKVEDPAQAMAHVQEALAIKHQTGDRLGAVQCIELAAVLAADQGDHAGGTRLLGAAAAVRDQIESPPDVDADAHHVTYLRDVLSEDSFTEAWEAGRALTLDEAVAEALAQSTG